MGNDQSKDEGKDKEQFAEAFKNRYKKKDDGDLFRRKIESIQPHETDPSLFIDTHLLLKPLVNPNMSSSSQQEFVNLLETNNFTDLNMIYGYQVSCEEEMVLLKSGRIIHDTYDYHPLVYAMIFEHQEILKYMVKNRDSLDLQTFLQVFNET